MDFWFSKPEHQDTVQIDHALYFRPIITYNAYLRLKHLKMLNDRCLYKHMQINKELELFVLFIQARVTLTALSLLSNLNKLI